MDSREQKVRSRIATLESEITAKQAELRRLTDALNVWLEIDAEDNPTTATQPAVAPDVAPAVAVGGRRFAGKSFLDAVYVLIAERGPLSTGAIHDALVQGGFESDAQNFRSVVSNMLNEAAKKGRLLKHGNRLNAEWSVPPLLARFQETE